MPELQISATAEPARDPAEAPQPDVSIVLPTFNERDNIVLLVDDLRSRFHEAGHSYEILVVDDASPDGTADLVRENFAGDPGVRVVDRRENPGLAASIREGVEHSTGATVVIMDSDFNHKPSDAVLLYEIGRHVDLAIGSRFTFGGGMSNLLRYYLSYLYNIFLRLVLGTRMDENLSGFVAIKRDRIFELDFDKIFWGYGDYFFRLLLLSQRKRFVHVALPVWYGERKGGVSKTRFIRIFLRYTAEVVRVLFLKVTGRW